MVRPYQPTDFEEIQVWGKKWGSDYDKDLFPKVGFIWPGVCAYFLYQTDSKVCYLENMVRNPDVPKEVSGLALEAVVTEILREAHKLGYKVAYATTASDAVIDRALKHGSTAYKGQTLLTLKLN